LLPPDAQRLGIAEELGQFDKARAVKAKVVVPAKAGTHNHSRPWLENKLGLQLFKK
jgi:hypothetical protein